MKKIIFTLFILLTTLTLGKDIILIQGAMDMEVDYLVSKLSNPKEERVASWTFWRGNIGKKEVIVSRTEVGLTNASAATTIAIERYKPTIIINQGTSGGHDPKLHSGDIVIAKEIINFGAIRTEKKEYGIPADSKNGIFFDVVQRLRDKEGNFQENPKFYSSNILIGKAKKVTYSNGKVVLGTVGTADQWNRELERIKYIHETFGTSVEEMETSAVAQIAKAYQIPFIGIRILSNTDIYSEEFNPKTALWCQEFIIDFINSL